MFFAEQTDLQYFSDKFGVGPIFCLLACWTLLLIFLRSENKSLDRKRSEEAQTNLKLLDIQNDKFLEALKQINKRDEIRFTKFHAKQSELIPELYASLVRLRSHSLVVIPGGATFGQDKITDLIKAIEHVQRFVEDNEIYFSDGLTVLVNKFLNELYGLCVEKQSLDCSPASIEWMKGAWDRLTKQLPSVLKAIRTELKLALQGESSRDID